MGDTELQVVSTDGKVLGAGEIGELWARGTAVMLGYWRRPDATAEAITPDGWFKTGDIVRMDSEGYVYIVDRQKDMINVAGEKVYPREVEEVLYAYPGVADATVVGIAILTRARCPRRSSCRERERRSTGRRSSPTAGSAWRPSRSLPRSSLSTRSPGALRARSYAGSCGTKSRAGRDKGRYGP